MWGASRLALWRVDGSGYLGPVRNISREPFGVMTEPWVDQYHRVIHGQIGVCMGREIIQDNTLMKKEILGC